jgi:hypothetical protein
MKVRVERLWDLFGRFVNETLKPMSAEELAKIMKAFPKELPGQYSEMLIGSITENCMAEFAQIIEERELGEKLGRLDQLIVQSRQFGLNVSVFDFRPTDPQVVKQAIVAEAKKREVEMLKRVLTGLEQQNSELESRLTDRERELASLEERVRTFENSFGL